MSTEPSGPRDPLDGPTPPPLARLELTAERRDAIRDEAAGALAHHAPDVTVVATLSLAELRASDAFGPVLARAHESSLFTQLTMVFVGTCDLDLAGKGDWVSFGVVHQPDDRAYQYDLVASGSWSKAELSACFTKQETATIWLDDHTFYATTRKADPEFLAARLQTRTRPSPLDAIGTRVDRHATGWIASRRDAMVGAVQDPRLLADFTARLELDADGLAGTGAFYLPDGKQAEACKTALDAQLATITDQPLMKLAFPELAVERDGTTVRVRGRLPAGLLDKFKDQLLEAMP